MTETYPLHGHKEDKLPDDHPMAFESQYCSVCNRMTHAFNNECMMPWLLVKDEVVCLDCFAEAREADHIIETWPGY